MPVKFKSEVSLDALNNATVDTNKFLVSDSGIVKYRTGSEVLADIGAQSALVDPITGLGTTNFLSKFTGATSLGNSQIFDNGINVGIGTDNPAGKLTILSTNNKYALELRNSSGDTRGGFFFDNTSGTNTSLLLQSSIGAETIALRSSGVSFLNGGDVGIGTTSPNAKLDVNGNILMSSTPLSSAILGSVQSSWAGNTGYPTLYGTSAERWVMHINPHISYVENGVNGYASTVMQGATIRMAAQSSAIQYWDVGIGTNLVGSDRFSIGRMNSSFLTITNGGNVGIGITSPNRALVVSGGEQEQLVLISTTSRCGISLNPSNTTFSPYIGSIGNDIVLDTFGSERMRITSGGDVGIGIVPQSWWGSRRAIEVFNGGAFTGVNAGWMEIWGNSYLDAAGPTTRYLQNGFASLYQLGNTVNGGHQWYTALSGTAGNAISFTQAMTLAANGNLLLGTTTDAGNKLNVNGSGFFSSSVTAGGGFEIPNGQFYRARRTSGGAIINVLGFEAGTDDLVQVFSNHWKLRGTGGVGDEKITVNSTGAATFSSSVTVGGSLDLTSTSNTIFTNNIAVVSSVANLVLNASSASLIFNAAGAERMRINTGTGNFLIGTTTDAGYKLYLNGNQGTFGTSFYLSTLNGTAIAIDHPGVNTWRIGVNNSNTSTFSIGNDIGGTFAAKYLNITSAGSVGIGTTSPGGLGELLMVNGSINSKNTALFFGDGLDNSASIYSTAGPIKFLANGSEKMRITAGGNVGIGTDNPVGNVGSTAMQIVGADYPVFTISSSSQSIDARLGIGFGNANVGTLTNHPFYVISNNAVSTTFLTNGNVGIGTTSPNAKLEVSADSLINGLTIGRGTGNTSTNTAIGFQALQDSTAGVDNNTALGFQALKANTSGDENTAIGSQALVNTGGKGNTAIGCFSLQGNTTGNNNTAIGVNAGRFIANGSTENASGDTSVFLGDNTKALAGSQTNQIVIGHNATGLGSDTVVLGNDSIVITALKGSVGVGTTAPDASAILDLTSTAQGFLPPRMSEAERDSIGSPVQGLMIFNIDSGHIDVFSGSTWRRLAYA